MHQPPAETRSPRSVMRLLFGLSDPVRRGEYFVVGVGLMALKYAVEAGTLLAVTGKWLSPAAFLSPLYTQRLALLDNAPAWVGIAYFVWTLPFLWVANSMSARRAADAGASPWAGLCVLIPGLNYAVMLLLCLVPTAKRRPAAAPNAATAEHLGYNPMPWKLAAVLVGPAITVVTMAVSVNWLNEYGLVVFLLAPMAIGATSAFLALRAEPARVGRAFGLALLSLLASGATLMLFALEGAICLLMAAPLILPTGLIGAAVGVTIAKSTIRPGRPYGPAVCVLILPLLAAAEPHLPGSPLRSVTTTVIVNAPPETVWRQVVAFPDLTEPPEWFFRAGIAAPVGATIDGSGVGAVRRCRFTTGEFVEPITTWDEPRLLAFDVARQPHPMAEVNPFGDPHPPHLDSALRSERGEFRLEPLPDGRTRLVGTTWYRLHMRPLDYWAILSDVIIHRIHARVLRHVKTLAEEEAAGS